MPREVMTIRLERAFRSRLQVVAERRSLTPSAAARLALEGWLDSEERSASGRPYEEIADLVGSVHGGDRGRSTRGRGFIARLLSRRRAARRRR
jgi:hypothetical protein